MCHRGEVRVLVVDDDKRLVRAVKRGLENEGFAVDVAFSGTDGWWHAREHAYDAMVLDVMLPGIDGLELCKRLREAGDWAPILVLTGTGGEWDEAHALDTGADDFLSKPFSYVVLVARLRALMRRGRSERPSALTVGDLRLDPSAHRVWRDLHEVELTPRQFSLLELLMSRPEEVLSKAEILEHVWDFAFDGDPNIVEVYISQLRRRIDEPFDVVSIHTVRGVGYRLTAATSSSPSSSSA